MGNSPTISAVIPTRDRPELVVRAVQSALRQTYPHLEVIVVVDGPDQRTSDALFKNGDPRLKVIVLPHPCGGSAARNAGVSIASGEWIALLDDDDEWLPEKTERQLHLALHSRHQTPIVSSRFIACTPRASYVWPRRIPGVKEDVSDYLFSRETFFKGEGLMVTPTLFTKKDLLLEVPFRPGLKKHQDWDWVLRATNRAGVGVEFEPTPLAVVHMEENRHGISNSDDWQYSRTWIREVRPYLTDRAFGAFLLTVVADQAASQTSVYEYLQLLGEAARSGRPQLFHVLLFMLIRIFPRRVRQQLRYQFRRSR